MSTIIVFSVSLFVAIILVIMKGLETRTGRKNPLYGLLGRFDVQILKTIAKIKFLIFQIIQIIKFLLTVRLKKYWKSKFAELKEIAKKEYQKRQDLVMGKKEMSSNGSVSFYLKKISENKDDVGKGKIEEGLPE